MARLHHAQKGNQERPRSVQEAFQMLKPKAVKPLDFGDLENVRELRPEESKGIIDLLSCRSVQARCAAAYIIGRLGIEEALPELMKGLKKTKSPSVRCMFEYAIVSLKIMEEFKCYPEKSEQLLTLMELRASNREEESKFADIVLKKANIQYDTVTSD
jgi:HEAT repeat protein